MIDIFEKKDLLFLYVQKILEGDWAWVYNLNDKTRPTWEELTIENHLFLNVFHEWLLKLHEKNVSDMEQSKELLLDYLYGQGFDINNEIIISIVDFAVQKPVLKF